MSIAGIDYSLRSPAICIFMGNSKAKFEFRDCLFFFLSDVKKNQRPFGRNITGEPFSRYTEDLQRYDSISEWAIQKTIGCDQVALEGYAYGAKGKVFHIAENTGVLKYKMYQNRMPLEIVEPTKVKKFATGKGNASKADMYASFTQESLVDLAKLIQPDREEIGNPLSDIVDAYYICKYLHAQLVG
tara:strand:- start:192 stop:749 length:558 start_codon:yes stop_codon:yes gene_type:complete